MSIPYNFNQALADPPRSRSLLSKISLSVNQRAASKRAGDGLAFTHDTLCRFGLEYPRCWRNSRRHHTRGIVRHHTGYAEHECQSDRSRSVELTKQIATALLRHSVYDVTAANVRRRDRKNVAGELAFSISFPNTDDGSRDSLISRVDQGGSISHNRQVFSRSAIKAIKRSSLGTMATNCHDCGL